MTVLRSYKEWCNYNSAFKFFILILFHFSEKTNQKLPPTEIQCGIRKNLNSNLNEDGPGSRGWNFEIAETGEFQRFKRNFK